MTLLNVTVEKSITSFLVAEFSINTNNTFLFFLFFLVNHIGLGYCILLAILKELSVYTSLFIWIMKSFVFSVFLVLQLNSFKTRLNKIRLTIMKILKKLQDRDWKVKHG